MAEHIEEQAFLPNEQAHDPIPSGLASNNADAENLATREPTVDSEPLATEQAGQEREDKATTPGLRASEPGLNLLFPHLEWARPGASSLQDDPSSSTSSNPCPVRRQRIPYIQPVDMDSAPGVPEGDLGLSSAFGLEDMPGILMYAPERSLLSPAASSMDAMPDHMMLFVEEDAFERAWIAPQWYWRSAF